MKKFGMWILWVVASFILLVGCATTPQVIYTPQSFTPPAKVEEYKLPADPSGPAPTPIFLKKGTDGKYTPCKREEADLTAFTSNDLDKITARIVYLKDINGQLVELVNIQIRRGNVLTELIVDQQMAKEIYRQLNVDLQNQVAHDKNWNSVEKGGLWAIIIGQLIAIIAHTL